MLNSSGFSYDVHSLVKAFCPEQDVNVAPSFPDGEAQIDVHVSPADVAGNRPVSGYVRVSAGPEGARYEREARYEDLERGEVKNLLKRTLYGVLSEMTGKILPWGTMTGIRPTKVVMKMIRDGADDERIREYMRSVYLCSDEKITLAAGIAHRESDILDGLEKDGFSLYIGIPFCPTTCLYCSFTSYPIIRWKERTDEYISALKKELDLFSEHYKGRFMSSLYIGGGTPTTLTPGQLHDLAGYVREKFDLSKLKEFTVEAGRPDSIDPEKLKALRMAGVDRISINPQTMNDKTLKIIGRRHDSRDVYKAFEMARSAGFDNINTDLILGLPGENEGDVEYTFDRIKELAPDSMTVHSMAIKRAAGMHQYLTEHKETLSRNTPEMMAIAQNAASDLGLDAYYLYRQKNMTGNFENVGYARGGCYGIYNIVMMEETEDIAAAGAGTISKHIYPDGRIERCDNVKDVELYLERIDEMINRKRKLLS